MRCSRCASCDFSFPSDRFTLGSHRFDEVGRRRSFERQSVANFSHDALLQRLNEGDACVSAGFLRSLQVHLGQFPRPTARLTLPHNLRTHSPFPCTMPPPPLPCPHQPPRSPPP